MHSWMMRPEELQQLAVCRAAGASWLQWFCGEPHQLYQCTPSVEFWGQVAVFAQFRACLEEGKLLRNFLIRWVLVIPGQKSGLIFREAPNPQPLPSAGWAQVGLGAAVML